MGMTPLPKMGEAALKLFECRRTWSLTSLTIQKKCGNKANEFLRPV